MCGLIWSGRAQTLTRKSLAERERSHWRYRELLPLDAELFPPEGGAGRRDGRR